jgi:UDP-GlcNAc:undecaprenyl-phosphate GlcNAc-1-phosphate transferase
MNAVSVILPFTSALGFCLLLTPILRNLAVRLGCVDRPDFDRKVHQVPVPRIGGVPVVLACVASYGMFLLLQPPGTSEQSLSLALKLLPASGLIFVTGVVDDLVGLKPIQKLGGQILAAVLACLGGLQFRILDGYTWGDPWGVALTLVWLVACTNAFNLIDGADGVAAGVGLIAALTALTVGLWWTNVGLSVLAAILAGSLLGFLRFNFNPASIFLGDSGSLWTGFTLGCFSILCSQSSVTPLGTVAPVVALAVPLTDMTLAVARRFVAAKPIFRADREHIHHRLLRRGFNSRGVALSLYGASAFASCTALLLSVTPWVFTGSVLISVFCGVGGMTIRRLGYQEFGIFLSLLRSARSHVQPQLSLNAYETRFREATSPEECWDVLCKARREFGLANITLRLGGSYFREQATGTGDSSWSLRIPLSASDHVSLTYRPEPSLTADTVARFADLVHRTLSEKAGAFRVVVKEQRGSVVTPITRPPARRPLILEPGIQHR